ncbi:MAG: hypothetical protein AAGM46_26120 [Cyanobacteria bacterium J06582_2]
MKLVVWCGGGAGMAEGVGDDWSDGVVGGTGCWAVGWVLTSDGVCGCCGALRVWEDVRFV